MRQRDQQRMESDLLRAEERIVGIFGMWEQAAPEQRGSMVAEIYQAIEVDRPDFRIEMVATPQPDWTPFFEHVIRLYGTTSGPEPV